MPLRSRDADVRRQTSVDSSIASGSEMASRCRKLFYVCASVCRSLLVVLGDDDEDDDGVITTIDNNCTEAYTISTLI